MSKSYKLAHLSSPLPRRAHESTIFPWDVFDLLLKSQSSNERSKGTFAF
jgi:hypothetical protein